jgi:hypothetical protein
MRLRLIGVLAALLMVAPVAGFARTPAAVSQPNTVAALSSKHSKKKAKKAKKWSKKKSSAKGKKMSKKEAKKKS